MKMIYHKKWLSLIFFSIIFLLGCQSTTNQSIPIKTLKVVNLNNEELTPINSTLTMEFSDSMDIGTLSLDSVYLLDSVGDRVDVVSLFVDTTHLSIEPKLFLKPLEKYKLIITTNIKSITGVALTEPYELNFMAGYSTDTSAPKLLALLPQKSTEVDIFTTIALQFNEALAIDDVDSLKLTDDNNQTVSGRAIEVGSYLRFIPSKPLLRGKRYTLRLISDVMDRSRNVYNGDKLWSFVVGDEVRYDNGIDPLKSHINLNTAVNFIHTYNGMIYVGATNKLFVIEITGDNKLNVKSTIPIDADVYDIALSGDFMALATNKGITIISTKTDSIITSFVTEAPVYGITYSDKYFYGAGSSAGLYILSADNGVPTQADFKAIPIAGTAFDVVSDGNYLYVAQYLDGVSQYTLTGEFVRNYTTKTATRSLNLYNNTLYVSSGIQGVSVITLADGHISSYPTLAFAMNSFIYKDRLYVADKEREIAVFNIHTGTRIAHIQNFDTPPSPNSNENDIYGITLANDMIITMSKKGTITTYSPLKDILLQVTELNATAVNKEDMNVTVKFNKNMDSSSVHTVDLVRIDTLGCFVHTQNNIIYSPRSILVEYIGSHIAGIDCNQAMTLAFDITIKDIVGKEITAPNSTIHLRIEDNTAPQVTTISPIDGYDALGEYNDTISITFDEDIDSASVNSTTIGLYSMRINSMETACVEYRIGTVSYEATTRRAIIDYPGPLSGIFYPSLDCNGTKFEIRVNGIKDTAGNRLAPPVTSSFKAEGL